MAVDFPGDAAPPGAEWIEVDRCNGQGLRKMATELASRHDRLDGLVDPVGASPPPWDEGRGESALAARLALRFPLP